MKLIFKQSTPPAFNVAPIDPSRVVISFHPEVTVRQAPHIEAQDAPNEEFTHAIQEILARIAINNDSGEESPPKRRRGN